MIPSAFAAALMGYLLGSIPFGLLIARMAGQGDVRKIGSGNIGATNVLRTGRKDLAALTLLGDAGKGFAAAFAGGLLLGPSGMAIAGAAAFLGHLFPVWLRFKGGKGVATYLGVLLAVNALAGLAFALIWIATAVATRYSSLSALVASGATPIVLFALEERVGALAFLGLTALLAFMHRANVKRLLSGDESRIGGEKDAA